MTRRKTLSDYAVKQLKPRDARYAEPDPELCGHYVRVFPSGAKTFAAVARDPTKPKGKQQVWAKIGETDKCKIAEARDRAREVIKRIQAGLAPFEAPKEAPESFEAAANNWVTRHVKKRGLRSACEIERCLARYVYPVWAERPFASITRSDVAKLLDTIEENNGARQASNVLAIVRSMMNWQATRSDSYVNPIVRGMGRCNAGPRKRILSDDEIRLIWPILDASNGYGALVKLLLLTAQREQKVATMKWSDIADGVWIIDSKDREKGNGVSLVLPAMALGVINARPVVAGNPYVFPGRAAGHFNGFSPCKRTLDDRITERNGAPISHWQLHDLRRTAKSLMMRAGVERFHAERVLGHAIDGVEGVYDRHSYSRERAVALDKLAAQVELILNPPTGNVVPLRAAVE